MSQIKLLSPISPIGFGLEKGTPIWALSVGTIAWIRKQNCAPETISTLDDAWDMFMHEGWYAILQRPRKADERTRLVCIRKTYAQCKEIIDYDKNEFIYSIAQKHVLAKGSYAQ